MIRSGAASRKDLRIFAADSGFNQQKLWKINTRIKNVELQMSDGDIQIPVANDDDDDVEVTFPAASRLQTRLKYSFEEPKVDFSRHF